MFFHAFEQIPCFLQKRKSKVQIQGFEGVLGSVGTLMENPSLKLSRLTEQL